MSNSPECIFCRIVAGTAPAEIVYRDDDVVAFLDIMPATRGHTLLVTRRHCDNILDASPEAIAAVGRASVALAAAVRQVAGSAGLGIYQLNGAAAGQTVFHYHMHLIPQDEGAGLQIHGRQLADPGELKQMADRIRASLPQSAPAP